MERNEPLLADAPAPWDGGWKLKDFFRPRNFWSAIVYNRRYKGFWAPSSMEAWRYRSFLRALDEVCLRSLKAHGALTARELADWLNREGLLHTKPELTGIHQITTATAHSWFELASRRRLVVEWACRHSTGRAPHWELSEQGRKDLHPKFLVLLGRLSRLFSRLLPALIVSGLLLGALDWLSLHPGLLAFVIVAALLLLVGTIPLLFMSRSERRQNPGMAVVAIETVRSAGKSIPAL